MILIADSGSTKCDWMMLEDGHTVLEFSTMGFNPYFHSSEVIRQKLKEKTELAPNIAAVNHVFFYGAGCSSKDLKAIVTKGLQSVFKNARIAVGHDLDAAALATYDGKPEIACILGTGSNSCFFDGHQVTEEIPALAYILGDEGSGSYIGKRLLADYFYKKMPVELAADFAAQYGINMQVIVEKVYAQPHANVYLASLARFCSDHRTHSYITLIIKEGMQKFLGTHVACYENHKIVPVNFVGSIAHYFEPELREVAREMSIEIGRIVKKPIQGLVDYHLKYTFAKSAKALI